MNCIKILTLFCPFSPSLSLFHFFPAVNLIYFQSQQRYPLFVYEPRSTVHQHNDVIPPRLTPYTMFKFHPSRHQFQKRAKAVPARSPRKTHVRVEVSFYHLITQLIGSIPLLLVLCCWLVFCSFVAFLSTNHCIYIFSQVQILSVFFGEGIFMDQGSL